MDKLSLDNQICFPLYALTRRITGHYQPLLEELDLTYPQYLVMLLLWETDRMNVKELGCRLQLDSGTLTPMLKRLEEKQMLDRTRCKADERIVEITLTDKGKALKKEAKDIPSRLKCSLSVADEDLIQLRDLLSRIHHKISKHNSI